MLGTPLLAAARRMLLPASLACVLSLVAGLTVTAPASASSGLTVSAAVDSKDDGRIDVTGSGTGGSGDSVYVFLNRASTPCATTPGGEEQVSGSYIYTASASGPFTFSTISGGSPGAFVACAYISSTYGSASQTAQSGTVSVLPCPADTSFTISNLTLGTTRVRNPQGKSYRGDYHGFVSFSVQTGFAASSTSNSPDAQLSAYIVETPEGAGIDGSWSWTTVSAQVGKYALDDDGLSPSGGDRTISVLVYPNNDYGRCYKSDGTVVQLGAFPDDYHAPTQTLKISLGAACAGGTATLDGTSIPAKNDSTSHPKATVWGPENCSGVVIPAKSGKCTQFTKLAKGYVCKHGKVVKAPPHKKRKHKR